MASWHDQINKHTVVRPSAIANAQNGRLPDSALAQIQDGNGHNVGLLEKTAAKAWAAMASAARRDGVVLSSVSSYRTFQSQKNLWDERYDHTNHGRGSRTCGGDRRYLKPGQATVACPGTSNHGLGLAVDTNHTGHGVLAWLEQHAATYGFEWEVPSEEWHIHYWPGDRIPAAVAATEEDDMTDAEKKALFDTLSEMRDNMRKLVERTADIDKRLAALEAKS